jgi:hypothetical protein
MIDPTCILTVRILWRATHKYNMLLVTENRRKHKYMIWWMSTWLIVDVTWRAMGYDVDY